MILSLIYIKLYTTNQRHIEYFFCERDKEISCMNPGSGVESLTARNFAEVDELRMSVQVVAGRQVAVLVALV